LFSFAASITKAVFNGSLAALTAMEMSKSAFV